MLVGKVPPAWDLGYAFCWLNKKSATAVLVPLKQLGL